MPRGRRKKRTVSTVATVSPALHAPKIVGGDVELGNFVLGLMGGVDSCALASRALLHEIDGLPRTDPFRGTDSKRNGRSDRDHAGRSAAYHGSSIGRGPWYGGGNGSYGGAGLPVVPHASEGRAESSSRAGQACDPQDWGRRYLPANGGCAYIDLDHLELCLPEVRSAREHLAAWHALLRITRGAREAANRSMPEGMKVQVLVNNTDGLGQSYGGHLNLCITREAWDNIFHRRLHHALFLASYQASSIIFTGQGKVGSENGRCAVPFQLSQRADFFHTLIGPQTTYHRPLVNSRDEALVGYGTREEKRAGHPAGRLARLHAICFDSNLQHVAHLLKVGVMQIILAMIEAGRVDPVLTLDDPVGAVLRWSHDPTLRARARTTSGWTVTALELQLRFLEEAERFVSSEEYPGTVPGEKEILALWRETLELLRAGDLAALARRLDWALKLTLLKRAVERRPGLDWRSSELKHLDQIYGSLDPEEGLYLSAQRAGLVEHLVTEEEIGGFASSPPEDTRAWTRAMLLRRAGPRRVEEVNWDRIRFRIPRADGFPTYRSLEMPDPGGFTRKETGELFDGKGSLEALLDGLEDLQSPRARSGRITADITPETSPARPCAGKGGLEHGNQGTERRPAGSAQTVRRGGR